MKTKANDSLGKIQPQALETEKAVLGALMLEADAIHKVSGIIDSGSFYSQQHQKIFSVIKALSDQNKPIDILTVTQMLSDSGELEQLGGALYITQLTNNVSSVAHIEHHAYVIAEKFLRREIIKIGFETTAEGFEEYVDFEELLNNLLQKISIIENYNTGSNVGKNQSKVLDEAILEIEQDCINTEKGISPGITTGFFILDKMTGGWRNTNFIIIASRPGVGKTSLALHHTKMAALSGKWVNFYGLEMKSEDLMRIMIASETGINRTSIRDGELTNNDWNIINQKSKSIYNLPIIWNDYAGITVSHIKSITRKNRKAHKCDLVVIDYLQLLSPTDKKLSREQQIAEISRELKKLALSENIPVIALSQLNREAENVTPQLNHLRESGSLEQDTDVVIMPWREDDTYNLGIRKNRRGELGIIRINANEEMTKFSDITNYPNSAF